MMEHAQNAPTPRTRRTFLRAAAAGVGVAAIGGASMIDADPVHAAGQAEEVRTFLAVALSAEMLAATVYDIALSAATFRIDDASRAHLVLAREAQVEHLGLLQGLGARAEHTRFYLPWQVLTDAGTFVRTGREIEGILGGLYMAAIREPAVVSRPSLAAAVARLGASAGQHDVLLGYLAGLSAPAVNRPAPSFTGVAQAMLALAPFVEGGKDDIGPVTFPVGGAAGSVARHAAASQVGCCTVGPLRTGAAPASAT